MTITAAAPGLVSIIWGRRPELQTAAHTAVGTLSPGRSDWIGIAQGQGSAYQVL